MEDEAKPVLLLVDDQEISLTMMVGVFGEEDYSFLTAKSGAEALELARRYRPDLMLLDVVMPEMDGFEVCRQVRQSKEIAEMPIVLVTALTDREARLEGFRVGADDFINKPFDRLEMRTRVRSITRLNRYRRLAEQRQELAQIRVEERVRKLIEGAMDLIATVDEAGRYRFVSPASKKLLGRSAEELLGRRLIDDVDPRDHPRVQAAFRRARSSTQTVEVQFRVRRIDGELRDFHARLRNALEDEDIQAFLWHARDVTEWRELWDRFLQAQKMEVTGQLAGGVAHDFNNFLAVILNYAGLILEGLAADSPVLEDVRVIEMAAQRGARVVGQLLTFSRSGTGEVIFSDPAEEIVKLDALIKAVMPSRIECTVAVEPDLSAMRIAEVHFEQILLNLIVNARDAIEGKGEVAVTLDERVSDEIRSDDTGRRVAPGHYIRIAVEDSGNGISEGVRGRIFDVFFTTKPVGEGTGLGLATVAELAHRTGGAVFVESWPGKGSRFEVWIPAVGQAA